MKLLNFQETIIEASLALQAEITQDQSYAIGLALTKRVMLVSDEFRILNLPMVVITKRKAMLGANNLQELYNSVFEAFKLAEKHNICVTIQAKDEGTYESISTNANPISLKKRELANIDVTQMETTDQQLAKVMKCFGVSKQKKRS